ncbi:mitochondrial ornithine transporter 1 [Cimex lectularius]|uniref:Mitochondrial ornithine transporter n=1 Tax=Cimex lectularius TaxID=79782 RepID=A0A8I6TD35_CIMLE|nr:mitochondrial ornithine transporter 1 [Cimex lectularius]
MSSNTTSRKFLDGAIDFTAGSLGGVALVYVGQPLDTIKVKLQTFNSLYSGPWDCFKKTLRTEGIRRGLYAGTVPALAANVAENSVLFAAYGGCQKCVAYATNTKIENLSALGNAFAGFLAAFFSSFTLCPTELIKVRLQAARELELTSKTNAVKKHRLNGFQMTKMILKTEGIRGMFRGLTSTIAREMPGYFVFFGGYEGTRMFLTPKGCTKEECGVLATMAAGAVGGVALWLVIFPADLVKSRIQVSSIDSSFYSVTLSIVRNEGVSALYNGLTPTLIRTMPATAILFLTYEYTKKLMHNVLDKNTLEDKKIKFM